MRRRALGTGGPEVSELSIGSWLTFSGGIEVEAAQACVNAAFEVGINFFDTANHYGRGAAEEALGRLLAGRPRDSYVLATKVFQPMSEDPAERGLSATQIARQIDASLRRLGIDHVDVYYAHRADPDVEIEETVEAFRALVAAGKVRYLGFSEWTVEQIEAAVDRSAGRTSSSPRNRSTRCSGGRRRRTSSGSAAGSGSGTSSGGRWRRAC